jgi:hypothetical protein
MSQMEELGKATEQQQNELRSSSRWNKPHAELQNKPVQISKQENIQITFSDDNVST